MKKFMYPKLMERTKKKESHINLKLILTLLKTFASIVITDDDNKSHQSS